MDPKNTLPRLLGDETYQELTGRSGEKVTLTYNDLWMLIVCQSTMDGDWVRLREAATMVADGPHKRELAERLWKLDQALGGLPAVPRDVQQMHLHRAHVWFNQRPVSRGKNW